MWARSFCWAGMYDITAVEILFKGINELINHGFEEEVPLLLLRGRYIVQHNETNFALLMKLFKENVTWRTLLLKTSKHLLTDRRCMRTSLRFLSDPLFRADSAYKMIMEAVLSTPNGIFAYKNRPDIFDGYPFEPPVVTPQPQTLEGITMMDPIQVADGWHSWVPYTLKEAYYKIICAWPSIHRTFIRKILNDAPNDITLFEIVNWAPHVYADEILAYIGSEEYYAGTSARYLLNGTFKNAACCQKLDQLVRVYNMVKGSHVYDSNHRPHMNY